MVDWSPYSPPYAPVTDATLDARGSRPEVESSATAGETALAFLPASYRSHDASVGSLLLLSLLGLSFPMAGFSAELSISQIAGYYSASNSGCTVVDQGKAEPCDPSENDWLRIEQVDAGHAHFHVYSVQIAGAQCEVEGDARWDGHALIYKDSDHRSPDFGYGFRIEFANDTIKFRYLPHPGPIPIFTPFCAGQANLETVKFRMNE